MEIDAQWINEWGVKFAPKRPIIFHPHFSDGVQDLSCASAPPRRTR
jgi:hypothetical protein